MPRAMEIATPLGDDVLLFHGMHALEEMSRLSEYRLELLSEKNDINVGEILGKNVTVKLALPDDRTRHFNGYVTRFSQGGTFGRYKRYSAVVRPWLWFLTRTADCRIFQDMTVPDIVKRVFDDHPTADFEFKLTATYRKWNYCVQYRETDFNFVSRLMEEEGIYYYVRHTDDHNTLVLSDSTDMQTTCAGYETVPFIAPEQLVRPELEHISSWDFSSEIQPGVYVHDDYDLERPSVELRTRSVLARNYAPSDYEVYDYPGHYLHKADGEQYAAVRIDELGSQFETAQAISNARGVSVGSLFTLDSYPREDQNREHLVLAATYDLEFSGYEAILGHTGTSYRCSFVAMSSKQQFRPKRITPKPFVRGPQTAIVVGPEGDEIYTDKFGRVKVQFHWDRYGKKDENSSCWIRVSQPWAGGGFGAITIPRIGHEVVVDFLEGDPDQPLILGGVYNAGMMPPFSLPENGTFSGIKSKSVKGNPSAHFSGLTFNDTPGSERVALYAEKNMMVNAEHDLKHHVGHRQHVQIGNMSLTTVGGIPGGGGSGGGGGAPPPPTGTTSATTDDHQQPGDPSFGNWKSSNGLLSAQPGMAGSVIYGVNSQDTVGLTHQITIGAAYQVCCNPLGYFGFIPNPASSTGGPLLGMLGAVGGNVQLCFGTNTQAIYGPAISINHGPQITFTGEPSTSTYFLAVLIPAVSLAYELAFAGMYSRDDQESLRDDLFKASVAVIALVNAVLLASEGADRTAQFATRAITLKTQDTLLSTSLGISNSTLLADFMKKMIPDAKVAQQALKPDSQLTVFDDANSVNVVDGVSLLNAKHIHLIAAKDPAAKVQDPNPSTVYINACGKGNDGVVFVNGSKGVVLTNTTQPGEMIELSTEGVTIEGGPKGKIKLRCGPPVTGPEIQMDPVQGITMMCGTSKISLHPITGITMSCTPSTIAVKADGVTIDGLNIALQAKLKHETKAMLEKKQVTLADLQITLAKHM